MCVYFSTRSIMSKRNTANSRHNFNVVYEFEILVYRKNVGIVRNLLYTEIILLVIGQCR